MKILTLDVGGTAIKSGICTEDGTFLQTDERESFGKQGGKVLLSKIYETIESYSGYNKIAVSTTAQVNSEEGVIVYSNQNVPDYTNTPIKKLLEQKYSVPVCVENDVNCAALGEAFYGAGKNYNDFICITYGTGVGGAIIIDRKLYKGSKHVAGEVGHFTTHARGLNCGCGFKGCYEQYSSTTALVRMAKQYDESLVNGRLIFKAFHLGDKKVINIVDGWIDEIAIGICSLIHVFNPSAVILGGGILEQSYILDRLNNIVYENIMESFKNVELKKALLGNNAGMLGALHLSLTI